MPIYLEKRGTDIFVCLRTDRELFDKIHANLIKRGFEIDEIYHWHDDLVEYFYKKPQKEFCKADYLFCRRNCDNSLT